MTPSQDYQRTRHARPRPLLKGVDAAVHAAMGVYQRRSRVLDELRSEAEKIDAMAREYEALSNKELRERLGECRDAVRRKGGKSDVVLAKGLAAIREAADRQLGLRPFVVQLMGALALHRGCLAEMATGEGKTLTAGLAAVLAGWTRQPCHIVTVNDYLVERDAAWLRPLYEICGVRVGCVTAAMSPLDRRKGYACDVTYTTSKEVLADFLRDRLQSGILREPTRRLIRQMLAPRGVQDGIVMRGLHTAIVDEADSILVDEAVTPLIISAPRQNQALREVVQAADGLVADLERGRDYQVDQRYREVELTGEGKRRLQEGAALLPGIWRGEERRHELVRQALVAREFFQEGKQYVLSEGKVIIVDEFTGRPMPQRSWRQGLHQAIEAKERVDLSDPTETVARLSFQRFFRLYRRLSGMTGTGRETAGEFWQIYKLPVVSLPTNRPCVRRHFPDQILATEHDKWHAIVQDIQRVHATGRPILVGTRNVAASEKLGQLLAEVGLNFRLLNAVRHQEEAQIVADAGQVGRITIATNMAGRGTDIKLGSGVAELGGLHVVATERHESGRVDRQLFGRSGRQGDPGSAQAFVSVQDELLRRYLSKPHQRMILSAVANRWPGWRLLAAQAFHRAQHNAQRLAAKQRAGVLRMDTWMEESLAFAGPDFA